MKSRIANVVSRVGIEPTERGCNRAPFKHLQPRKPARANAVRGVAALAVVIGVVAAFGCGPIPASPTAPSVAEPDRSVVQLVIAVIGPDTWWTDRLFVLVTAYDRTGAETNAVVECNSTDGLFEPRAFSTFSHKGVPIRGVKAGAVITCRHKTIEAHYHVATLDWRLRCCGGPNPAPAAPPPPPGEGT